MINTNAKIKLLHQMETGIQGAKLIWQVEPSSTTNNAEIIISIEKTEKGEFSGIPLLTTNISGSITTLSDTDKVNLLLDEDNRNAIRYKFLTFQKEAQKNPRLYKKIYNILVLKKFMDIMYAMNNDKQLSTSRRTSIDLSSTQQNDNYCCHCNCL